MTAFSSSAKFIAIVLFLCSMFVFTRHLDIHGLEYRDDEIFYFKATQEMIAQQEYLSPVYFDENRFQKPILFYWIIFVGYEIFGLNWIGARFFSSVFASGIVLITFALTKKYFNTRVATLSSFLIMTLPMFFRHAKNVVPDMTLTFFIVLAIYMGLLFLDRQYFRYGFLFFLSCALGFMIKGFVAIIIPFLVVILFAIKHKQVQALKKINFPLGFVLMSVVILPWFVYMAMRHGDVYVSYMIMDETKQRLVGDQSVNALFSLAKTFVMNVGFYTRIILSYFAPWSIFIFLAIPLAWSRSRSNHSQQRGIRMAILWFSVVFIFYSLLHFRINHYLMGLTVPFSILLSFYLLEPLDSNHLFEKICSFARKYVLLVIFSVGYIGYSIFLVFLLEWPKIIVLPLFIGLVVSISVMLRNKSLMVRPMMLIVFILLTFSQSQLLGKAGVTTHSVLQQFANTINADTLDAYSIGVGSHGIHEKEFQAYFDKKVVKAAVDYEEGTRDRMRDLFAPDDKVYCLIKKKDYDYFLKDGTYGAMEIVQEEYMIRKKMAIDSGFFKAIVKLDQDRVVDYLKEKIYLVKKEGHLES